jgi:Flp pilus assembly protein CpaB
MEKDGGGELICDCGLLNADTNVLEFRMSKFEMRIFYVILILAVALAGVAGCVTKSQADAQARAAYLAGERAAYQTIESSQTAIVVMGNVQKHQVPWVEGLTLGQALATAVYTGQHDPQEIIVKRNSVEIPVDPRQLLSGQANMTLQPGDVVSVVGE